MSRDLLDTLNSISASLATLALEVRSEALAGLGSRNKIAEHVLLPVFRRLYHAPNLVNANTLGANFPGIDLIDRSSGLGVQVTSESAKAKITKTITTLVNGKVSIKRLVVGLLVQSTPRYRAETRSEWKAAAEGHFQFEPDTDVLAFDRLLLRIQTLSQDDITAIDAELKALVRGTHAIHLLPHLRQQVKTQLAEEQRIVRYIPGVFVETQDTKYQARCFAHPALFLHRIADWFDRKPLAELNRFAAMGGVPPVGVPSTKPLADARTVEDATTAAEMFRGELDTVDTTLTAHIEMGKTGGACVPRDATRAYALDAVKYYIETIGHRTQRRLGDRRTELRCVAARIFLLTGHAGQGKTNFLCDFAERFLLRQDIPCAYVTARQMSRILHADLSHVLCRMIFPRAVASLDEGLANLAAACAEQGQPFVLVIDGLNEHPDVRTFAGQLEYLLETLVRYPHVRVLMTCRSEFLEQRFGMLRSGPIAPVLYLSTADGQRFDDEQYRELVVRYFRFFRVRPSRVAHRVIEFLRRDVLLLRFFCEAYGARGRDASYKQPFVGGIYRDEIFRRYVQVKLERAERTVTDDRSIRRALVSRPKFRSVLSLVAAHMLQTRMFADVPRSVVPSSLDEELTALLDEHLVLRHDLGPAPSLLAEPTELLNFTFDELRDYFLAKHLLGVYAQDPDEFARLVAAQQPTIAQSIEGLQRFLFYASRAPGDPAFFESYREHQWYSAVYDTEIFDIPPSYLRAEDQRIVEEALEAGGARARHFAKKLAVLWVLAAGFFGRGLGVCG